jgi:hypothetical protein
MSRTKRPEHFYEGSQLLGQRVEQKSVTLELPPAHPKQYEFITALDTYKHKGVRFIVGACGTKWGKTYGSSIAIVQKAWNRKHSLNWWVAPTYAQSKMAYNLVMRLLPKDMYIEHKADMRITLLQPDGTDRSTIEFKSGENPDSLRGFGVNFFIIDEGARVPYESFVSVMTTVTQTRGNGFIISTPHFRNWFYDVYQRGEKYDEDGNPLYPNEADDPWPEWFSIRMPTWQNPTVDPKSIEEMKKNLPEDIFRQEVAAQFLLDSAGVFRGVKDCVKGDFQAPLPGHSYVMGVDLARLKDYTVLTVMDRQARHVVAFERFNQISWEVQYHKIVSMAKKYRAHVCIDTTGIGDPIVEQIKRAGVQVTPYKITGSTAKQQLIDKLRVNIEDGSISYPVIPIQRKELESYEYEVTESGVVKYSAPSGSHDDCVISLALANWLVSQPQLIYTFSNHRGI